jgi:uncharacterized protein YgbK (DUF1537 family)
MNALAEAERPLFVIDDDPTGAQGQADVPLLLSWRAGLIEATLRDSPRALHLLTNSRALDADSAYAVVRDAAAAVESASAKARVVMRGDSTLRAHLLPEYAGVRDVLCPGASPPLLLVPALPAAGRVTRDGRHWLVRDGQRVPLEETEFARDGDLSYATSRLIDWADERSSGYFAADNGIEVGHEAIRSEHGPEHVRAALVDAARGADPTVVVPDAETVEDLEVIAAGLRVAWMESPQILVRCAPTFASVLSGAGATGLVDLPPVDRGLLVVVGSHVPMSTAQLAAVNAKHGDALIEVDAGTLAGDYAPVEIGAAVDRARANLKSHRLAVVATTRAIAAEALGPEAGMRVARGLAEIVARLRDASDVLLSKGGITSAVNVSDGLGAERAQIVGPVAPGVSLWLAHEPEGEDRPVIVFPGNVGDEGTLAELVDRLLGN